MKTKALILILICLNIMVAAMAHEEVAMVTEIVGMATASHSERGGEAGDQEWQLEIAEMLQPDVTITTGKDSFLSIIHLWGDTEYQIGEQASVRITTEAIEGSVSSSQAIAKIAADFQLSEAMQNQVGAVIVDHVSAQTPKSEPRSETEKSTSRIVRKLTRPSATLPESAGGAMKKSSARTPAQESPRDTSDTFEQASFSPDQKIDVSFALPLEILNKIGETSTDIDFPGFTAHKIDEFDGWVELTIRLSATELAHEAKVVGAYGTLPITLYCQEVPLSVLAAWNLEQKGLLAQAAAIWLALQQTDAFSSAKTASHLRRIRKKLLLSQK